MEWRWLALALALACVYAASSPAKAGAGFRDYAPGSFAYTSSAVSSDPCPFASQDGVQLLQRTGADVSAMCPSGGLRVGTAYYADAADLAVSSYCLEESAGTSVSDVAAKAGATVTPLAAPTLAGLLQAAQAKAPTGTPQASMLLVAQRPAYGGAYLTSTRAAGFDRSAFAAARRPEEVSLDGLLLTVATIEAIPSLEQVLTSAFRTSSQLCNVRCVDAPTKRCGCASGSGATCVSTQVKDYADYASTQNASVFWVVYRGGF